MTDTQILHDYEKCFTEALQTFKREQKSTKTTTMINAVFWHYDKHIKRRVSTSSLIRIFLFIVFVLFYRHKC